MTFDSMGFAADGGGGAGVEGREGGSSSDGGRATLQMNSSHLSGIFHSS